MSKPISIHIPAIDGETEEACAARIEAALLSRGIDPGSLVPIVSEHGHVASNAGPITLHGSFFAEPPLCIPASSEPTPWIEK